MKIPMKKMPLLIAALAFEIGTILSSAPAFAYDDPAVAICEYVWFRGAPPRREGFKRVGSKIEGDLVRLEYDRSVLNTAPKRSTLECTFSKGDDGKFALVRPGRVNETDPDVIRCRKIVAMGQAEIDTGKLDIGETAIARTKMGLCDRTLNVDPEADAALDLLDRQVRMLGIYPIEPADTELRARP